jgi:hypothetical protein
MTCHSPNGLRLPVQVCCHPTAFGRGVKRSCSNQSGNMSRQGHSSQQYWNLSVFSEERTGAPAEPRLCTVDAHRWRARPIAQALGTGASGEGAHLAAVARVERCHVIAALLRHPDVHPVKDQAIEAGNSVTELNASDGSKVGEFLEERSREAKLSGSFTPSYHQEQEIRNRKIGYTLATMSGARCALERARPPSVSRRRHSSVISPRWQRHGGGDGVGSKVVLREVGAPSEIRAARPR